MYEFSILMKIQVSTHLVLTIENERCLDIYLIICIVHEFWTYLGFVCVCGHITLYATIFAY